MYEARVGRGMTSTAFCEEIGVGRVYYSNLEAGRNTVKPAIALAFAKRVGADERVFLRAALMDICDAVGFAERVDITVK